MDWFQWIDEEQLTGWRRWLHQHPEVAFQEEKTSEYIVQELSKIPDIQVIRPTETSILGILKGDKPGKVVALRADIDALPIEEEAEVEFPSQNPGVMHACGHDTHAAMLLGAAFVLSKMKNQIEGTIKFIFQHAEEKTPGGAQSILDTGCLDDVDCFFGQHIMPMMPVGTVASRVGSFMAAQDSFVLKIQGKGSHGSMPQESVDPIMVGSDLVMNINQIVSRNISPLDRVVISMGRFTSGSIFNIIPDKAELEGTIRTNTEETREFAEKRIREVIEGICLAHGASYELDYRRGYHVVVNDEACVEIAEKAAQIVLGKDAYRIMEPMMGSEDFSAYQKKAPGVYMMLGGGRKEDGFCYVHHHPKFKVDEKALAAGTKMYVGFALEAVKKI